MSDLNVSVGKSVIGKADVIEQHGEEVKKIMAKD